MVYGSERSVRKGKDGVEQSQCLIWTDTWLKRGGSWQIIAAQDTRFDASRTAPSVLIWNSRKLNLRSAVGRSLGCGVLPVENSTSCLPVSWAITSCVVTDSYEKQPTIRCGSRNEDVSVDLCRLIFFPRCVGLYLAGGGRSIS